jgi:hypothetical protein
MLNKENLDNYGTSYSRSIYIGQIEKDTLHKPLDYLDDKERKDYDLLKDQMVWGKDNGYNLVLTNDSKQIDCWMIRDRSMHELNPLFKRTILQVF